MQLVDDRQRAGAIVLANTFRQAEQMLPPGQTRHAADQIGRDRVALPGALVEQTQRVAQSAVRHAGDEQRRLPLERDILTLGHRRQTFGDVLRLDALEIEPLTAGQDGGGELVHLGGG